MCSLVTTGQVRLNTVRARRCASCEPPATLLRAREDHGGAVGNLLEFLDDHRTDGAKAVHHIFIVDPLMAH